MTRGCLAGHQDERRVWSLCPRRASWPALLGSPWDYAQSPRGLGEHPFVTSLVTGERRAFGTADTIHAFRDLCLGDSDDPQAK